MQAAGKVPAGKQRHSQLKALLGEDLLPSSLMWLWKDSVSCVGLRTSAPQLWVRGHPQFFAIEL